MISTTLGLTANKISVESSVNLDIPTQEFTYQLYAGGPLYSATVVPSSLSYMTLTANAATNPLGIFYCSGNVTIGNHVSIAGTLVCDGSVTINGAGVTLSTASLTPLSGSTTPIRLPCLVASGNLNCNSGTSASITGTVVLGQQFVAATGTQATAFKLTGHLVCTDCLIEARNEWNVSSSTWSSWSTAYKNQGKRGYSGSTYQYFPLYLAAQGLTITPQIVLSSPTTTYTDQWQNLGGPIYVPASGDIGLRWDLMNWDEL